MLDENCSINNREDNSRLSKDLFIKGICKTCGHEGKILELHDHVQRMDKFITEVSPLMDYVKAEIKRNERRTRFYDRLTEQVLGAAVLAVLGFIGNWLISLVKLKYFND